MYMEGTEKLFDLFKSAYDHGLEFRNVGDLPDYIPELARVDKDGLAITIKLNNGKIFSFGDDEREFTIQSMVKVFILICALEEVGEYRVFKYVGMKPSSQSFNSVVGLELSDRKPVNPFINAGAIALVNLLGDDAFETVINKIRKISARDSISYSEEVFNSEFSTGETNRALAYLMKAGGILKKDVDVEKLLENYFKLCSILVNTKDLAACGAIIANGGIDPRTQKVVIDERIVHIITTLMCTCGMYDYSGEFAMSCGLPAKSGVSGGILSLSPGDLGIGVYSPGLDSHGNSIAGMKMLSYLSNKLALNIYRKNDPILGKNIERMEV